MYQARSIKIRSVAIKIANTKDAQIKLSREEFVSGMELRERLANMKDVPRMLTVEEFVGHTEQR